MNVLLYFLFFCSGLSGLIYQVVWVRVFGNVFGNTIYSAAMVVAVFMLGLGAGSYAVGAWADRRYAERPDSLLRSYGIIEAIIAALGLGIALLLPHLGALSASVSSYTPGVNGWLELSAVSYAARVAIALLLLVPITLLMGGTLTLLIRHLVRGDVAANGSRIALLYSVNTAGAALGCLLTDFALVPSYGLLNTQLIAVGFNVIAGVGALALAGREAPLTPKAHATSRRSKAKAKAEDSQFTVPHSPLPADSRLLIGVSLALALAGFAAMGMEILWFRHFTILLGQFRAVFSLLLAIILVGIGIGALLAGAVQRRSARPAVWFMLVQALFVASTLAGLFAADSSTLDAAVRADPMFRASAGLSAAFESGAARPLTELWFNGRPMLIEVALPALLMGFSFPLANAIVQRIEASVGRRAGVLYLANTIGAVLGSLAAGFVLLPQLGMQGTATMLMTAAALAILCVAASAVRTALIPSAVAVAIAALAIGGWWTIPPNHVIARALPVLGPGQQQLTLQEGVNEVISIVATPTGRRMLMTNGHAMSSTLPLSQRYMRALAHLPLLALDNPERALIIGFGVGNTTHAVALHPSMRQIDIADLSKDILAHASYFSEFNRDVLRDPRVTVHVNDGRQHLQMQPAGSYDLITLEPPPIGYAGVAALYSREFYELAFSRLKATGYVSQWLPTYQVPTETTLAMVRAFIDVFPNAVLLSGAESDLLLLGAKGAPIAIDPTHLAARIASTPAVRADLQRLDLGSVTEIVGMFVGSASRLAQAARETPPVTDDKPIQEYGVLSLLNFGDAVPAAIVNLDEIGEWCPACLIDGRPAPIVAGLDAYMALLRSAYTAPPAEVVQVQALAAREGREVAGSRYLGAIVPESTDVHTILGLSLASAGNLDAAIAEFRASLAERPASAATHWHLGSALAARDATAEAIQELQRSVELDPSNARAQDDLGTLLAITGRMSDAIRHFEQALALDPSSEEVRRKLELAYKANGQPGSSN